METIQFDAKEEGSNNQDGSDPIGLDKGRSCNESIKSVEIDGVVTLDSSMSRSSL